MKNQIYLITIAIIGMAFLAFLAISAMCEAKKSEIELQQIKDLQIKTLKATDIRQYTFYYTDFDKKPAVYKRLQLASSVFEEWQLSSYLIKHQTWSSDCSPYYDMSDSISIATLDTASIGFNFPCKMVELKWKEKIIWRKN